MQKGSYDTPLLDTSSKLQRWCKSDLMTPPLLDTSSPPSDISSPSPDCHLISVSPSSPVFLLLVLHLSPSDYIGSHPQNTRMQTPKYKSTVTNTQAQVFYSSTYTYLNGDEHNSQCDGNYSLRYDQHEQVALYSLLTLSSKQFHP